MVAGFDDEHAAVSLRVPIFVEKLGDGAGCVIKDALMEQSDQRAGMAEKQRAAEGLVRGEQGFEQMHMRILAAGQRGGKAFDKAAGGVDERARYPFGQRFRAGL